MIGYASKGFLRTIAVPAMAILCAVFATLPSPGTGEGRVGAAAAQSAAPALKTADELTTRSVRVEESNLANVIADAVRALEKSDIALIAATSFLDVTLAKGDVTADDILRALAFRGDTVVIMRLTGAQVKRALEHGLGLYPARSAAFLQVSGLSMVVDPTADRNARIQSAKVGKDPLDEAKTYSVAMPSPLAGGALVYSKAWSKDDIERDTRKTLEDAVRSFIASAASSRERPASGPRIAFKG